MKRRSALQAILFFSVSANAIISCKNNSEVIGKLGLKNLVLDDDRVSLIDDLTKNLFPIDNHPMFKGHTSMPFVLQMVDGLYSKEDRDRYVEGIKAFDQLSNSENKKPYQSLSKEEKLLFLKKLDDSKESTNAKHFFDITKKQTVTYFTTTEDYLRGVVKYEMVPGRWNGCIKIDQIQSKKQ